MRLILGTTNEGKRRELERRLGGQGIEVRALAGLEGLPDIEEDRDSFEGNAEKKAQVLADLLGSAVLADDSGLCVDVLKGAPGVHSARYAADDQARMRRLLEALRSTPTADRTARFVCVLALACPGRKVELFRGVCEGRIAREPRGTGGFGYDPVFEFSDGRTMAELSAAEKEACSHRGRALEAFCTWLEQNPGALT